ncbi:MAG: murein biosynthesis integral membrane protein MurJ [Caldisericaceae bacterium]
MGNEIRNSGQDNREPVAAKHRFLEQNAVQATTLFIASAILSKVLGFVRDVLVGAYFGVSKSADALSATLPITSIFQNIVTGALTVSLIPIFLEYLERDRKKAMRDLNVSFNYITSAFLLTAILMSAFSTPLVNVITPGFAGSNQQLMVSMLIDIFAIGSFLWAVTDFLFGIAQSKKHFLITAAVPLLSNLFIIIGLVAFHKRLGVYSYPIGMIAGVFLQLIIMVYYSWKYLGMRFTFDFDPQGTFLPKLLILSIPLILQQLVNYSVTFVANNLASKLETGSIASIQYANKLRQLSIGILTVPLATSYYPFLSEAVTKKDQQSLSDIFSNSIRFASFLVIPVMCVSIVFAEPIIKIVYERGSFDAAAVALTVKPLQYYSLGIIATMVTVIIMRVLYAMKEMYLTLFVSIITAGINIALFFPLIQAGGHAGIPLAVSIGTFFEMFVFMFVLKKKNGFLEFKSVFYSLVKITIASLVSTGAMYVVFSYVAKILPHTNKYLAVNFLGSAIIFVIIYVAALFAVKSEEVETLRKALKKISRKKF